MKTVAAQSVLIAWASLTTLGFQSARMEPIVLPAAGGPAAVESRSYPQTGKSMGEVNPKGYTSARVCGQCHEDIYNSWKNSLHAFSLTDPIFDTAFMQAVREGGEDARQFCLHCHAPMTMINGDYELKEGVTREGVSCDFCHSVTAVHLDGRAKPFSSEAGRVKRGDIRSTGSPAHEVAYSKLHTTSEFCGGCHNYIAEGGAAIMSTYDEWKRGPYAAEGVQCQNCHMVLSAGKVVLQTVKRSRDKIHLHSLIRDSEQLKSALSVSIDMAQRRGDTVDVEVTVENVGSGHMIPTGMPTREVVLEVTAESGGYARKQERRYRKVVADSRGLPLKTDYETILKGVRVLNDNRIAPREKRVERFQFRVRDSGPVQLEAALAYQYSPAMIGVREINVRLDEAKHVVR